MRNSYWGLWIRHILLKYAWSSLSSHFSKRIGWHTFFFRWNLRSNWFWSHIISLVFIPTMIISSKLRCSRERKLRFGILNTWVKFVYHIGIWSNLWRSRYLGNQVGLPLLFSSISKAELWRILNFMSHRGIVNMSWRLLVLFDLILKSWLKSNSHYCWLLLPWFVSF